MIQYGLQMKQNLKNILIGANNKDFATKNGMRMHTILQHVVVDDIKGNCGANDIVEIIKERPDLRPFFASNARTEVPVAGFVNGVFISRRIDRLLINHDTKTINFIDYKTDIDKTEFVEQYKKQLNEYALLLRSAYPKYQINGYILWLNDWVLDQVIC